MAFHSTRLVPAWKDGTEVVGIYNYTARKSGTSTELSFEKGDVLYFESPVNESWFWGRNGKGQKGWIPYNHVQKPLTVVLLGKTGNGKSATGNEIIGAKVEHFSVSDSPRSVTDKCRRGTGTANGRKVTVIDTPGILMPAYRKGQERILRELTKMYTMAPQGFDAIILVAKFGQRFTAEDAEALKLLKRFLGKESESHMILLLTRGDDADRNAKRKKIPVERHVKQWISGLPDWVQDFIHQIGDRIVLFNNLLEVDKDSEAYHQQLKRLIKMIDKMTNGKPYVNFKAQEVVNARIEEALNASQLI